MGNRSRKDGNEVEKISNGSKSTKKLIIVEEAAVDSTLAALFASSAGPVKAPPKTRYQELPPTRKQPVTDETDAEVEGQVGDDIDELSSLDGDVEDADLEDESTNEEDQISEEEPVLDKIIEANYPKPERKRKRKADEEDLEGKYMQKLAREEEKEEEERQAERRLKRQKVLAEQNVDMSDAEDGEKETDASEDEIHEDSEKAPSRFTPSDVPLHESLAPNKDAQELEKATRTVFLANVSTTAISSKPDKKVLLTHMGSFLSDLPTPPEGKPPHRVESIRFRSTAYAGTALPKKAAFAKKDLMAATTKSTNAYVVYSTAYAAREAVKKLNGTVVLDRHLRVDGVAHPSKTDHRRCVFVGNLGFVDDESMLDQTGENERKRSKIPSDVEEGLWRQFSKAGTVESVRVVRDEKTRVGKGFAYVQFEDPNAVEAALLFNEKKYPPMLPRVLRVVRAKAVKKTERAFAASRVDSKYSKQHGSKESIYNPKVTSELSSLKGRAGKLLGRAGAAQLNKKGASGANGTIMGKRTSGAGAANSVMKTPEAIVFEGYRASAKNGRPKDLKLGGKGGGKKQGKPKTRSTKRASEWKKGGVKK